MVAGLNGARAAYEEVATRSPLLFSSPATRSRRHRLRLLATASLGRPSISRLHLRLHLGQPPLPPQPTASDCGSACSLCLRLPPRRPPPLLGPSLGAMDARLCFFPSSYLLPARLCFSSPSWSPSATACVAASAYRLSSLSLAPPSASASTSCNGRR